MGKENKSFLSRFGALPLILFWLAIEYVTGFYLGSLISPKWVNYTGFGGASLWVLVSAWLLYLALFRKWQYTLVFVIVIVGPILYSYSLQYEPLTRSDEWVARTAAWISVLILLNIIIKEFTRKK